jgi:hypothetical protein
MSSDMKDTELDSLIDQYFPKDKRHARGQAILMKPAIQQLIKRETDRAHQEGYKKGYINAGIEALNG